MTAYFKMISNTVSCNATANDFFSAKLVRIVNANTTPALITLQANATANLATVIILGGQESYIRKDPAQLLISNNNLGLFGSAVGFF